MAAPCPNFHQPSMSYPLKFNPETPIPGYNSPMKSKIAKILTFTALALSLTACASAPQDSHTGRPAKYQPALPASQYGDWFIEPQTCTIRARAADFSLITDGIPNNGTITVRTLFKTPLVQPPRAEISEILAPIPVEGSRRGYSIILAYDSANAAHMFKDDTFLMVRYQPIISAEVLESSFQTHGLMFALADLAKFCEQ